jgi:hypothetical protein
MEEKKVGDPIEWTPKEKEGPKRGEVQVKISSSWKRKRVLGP